MPITVSHRVNKLTNFLRALYLYLFSTLIVCRLQQRCILLFRQARMQRERDSSNGYSVKAKIITPGSSTTLVVTIKGIKSMYGLVESIWRYMEEQGFNKRTDKMAVGDYVIDNDLSLTLEELVTLIDRRPIYIYRGLALKENGLAFMVTIEDMKNNAREISLMPDVDIIDFYRSVAQAFSDINGSSNRSFVILDAQFNTLGDKYYEEKIVEWELEKDPLFFIMALKEGESMPRQVQDHLMSKKARLNMGNEKVFAFLKGE